MRSRSTRLLALYAMFMFMTGSLSYLSGPDRPRDILVPAIAAILSLVWRSRIGQGELWGYTAALLTAGGVVLYCLWVLVSAVSGLGPSADDTLLMLLLVIMICGSSLGMMYVLYKDWKRQKRFYSLFE